MSALCRCRVAQCENAQYKHIRNDVSKIIGGTVVIKTTLYTEHYIYVSR